MTGALLPIRPMTRTKKNILIVEDEADLSELLRYNLEREGYQCRLAGSGDAALSEARRAPPDLIILDRMLPGLPGDEVASRLKRDSRCSSVPIIMLTAKAEETDELVGFALGADDYVTKPFSMKLLLVRVAAVLRRAEPMQSEPEALSAGPVVADRGRHEVTVNGRNVPITATEFRILAALMQARGRVLDRAQLIDRALGADVVVSDRTIDVHVTSLRKKLAAAAAWIHTVRGVGYAFREPGDSDES